MLCLIMSNLNWYFVHRIPDSYFRSFKKKKIKSKKLRKEFASKFLTQEAVHDGNNYRHEDRADNLNAYIDAPTHPAIR